MNYWQNWLNRRCCTCTEPNNSTSCLFFHAWTMVHLNKAAELLIAGQWCCQNVIIYSDKYQSDVVWLKFFHWQYETERSSRLRRLSSSRSHRAFLCFVNKFQHHTEKRHVIQGQSTPFSLVMIFTHPHRYWPRAFGSVCLRTASLHTMMEAEDVRVHTQSEI